MLRFAVGNLISRPVRSALSILGLTVAIAGMVGLFSVAGGIDSLVSSTFELIPGLLIQQRGAPVPLFSTLPGDWQADLEDIDGVTVVNPQILVRANLIEGKTVISPPRFLLGVDIPSRMQLKEGVYDHYLESGRFLVMEDAGTSNCVLSRQIADEFEKDLGDGLVVNGHELTIVGIYRCDSILLDVNILMDIGALRTISRFDPNSVSVYYAETADDANQEPISRAIEERFADRANGAWNSASLGSVLFGGPADAGDPLTSLFRDLDASLKQRAESETDALTDAPETTQSAASGGRQHAADTAESSAAPGTPPDDPTAESPVEVRSADDWAESFEEFTADLDLFLSLMTFIGVAVAVLSIVNTMLMSVTERRIEFGILRANGWSRGHVLRLVTFESALLGLFGGVLGAIFGWLATHVINWSFPDRVHLFAGAGLLLFSLLFSIALGIAGGAYPAWMAARLSPMEAIRRG